MGKVVNDEFIYKRNGRKRTSQKKGRVIQGRVCGFDDGSYGYVIC